MANHAADHGQGRPLSDILLEIKDELFEFMETRIRMARAEFEETRDSLKAWLPWTAIALVSLSTAYLLLVAALVSVVSFAMVNNPFRWPLAFLIVGILFLVGGVTAAALARNVFRTHGTFPKKTIEILKQDRLWLPKEVKHPS